MESLLQHLELPKRSLLQRLFKQYPTETPMIALNNLLLSKGWVQVTHQDIESINKQYEVDLLKMFHINLIEYYAVYVNACLEDDALDLPKDQNIVKHLISIFKLTVQEVQSINRLLGENHYRERYEIALKNGISKEEEVVLAQIVMFLNLEDSFISKLRKEIGSIHLNSYVNQRLKRVSLAPEEDAALLKAAERFGVTATLSESLVTAWRKKRKLWELEYSQLPVLTSINYQQKDEDCYFIDEKAMWHEWRVSRGESYVKHIDTGTLLLTTKRLIFTGREKVTQLPFGKIQDFIGAQGLIEIRKATGRSPLLLLNEPEQFCIILGRLMREQV